jgi:hypothetical protein
LLINTNEAVRKKAAIIREFLSHRRVQGRQRIIIHCFRMKDLHPVPGTGLDLLRLAEE